MYFGHKHVETGSNCSHELATFFKYHMPLNSDNLQIKKIRTVRTNSAMRERELKGTQRSDTASLFLTPLNDFKLFTSPLFRPLVPHHRKN